VSSKIQHVSNQFTLDFAKIQADRSLYAHCPLDLWRNIHFGSSGLNSAYGLDTQRCAKHSAAA